jgi:peptidyl-tRNA hydrolase
VTERVLPLVVRIERDEPPARTAALEAAAIAVLSRLSDPRSLGGEWSDAVRDWEDHRIRKVVRRARGAPWRRAEALAGLSIEHGGAQVRVFPPVPLDDWPRELAQLQVAGTDLDSDEPPAPPAGEPVIWLAPDQPMTAGKAMAQAGHAAQLGWWATDDARRAQWRAAGFPLAVRTAAPPTWAALLGSGLPLVQDAGFTEVEPGARTAVADFPWLARA